MRIGDDEGEVNANRVGVNLAVRIKSSRRLDRYES
jgi:hypothetical protein